MFQNIRPLSARPCVAMFQVLAEMVGTVEFLRIVTFAEFMDAGQMFESAIPVRLREIGEFLSAVTTCVVGRTGVRLR